MVLKTKDYFENTVKKMVFGTAKIIFMNQRKNQKSQPKGKIIIQPKQKIKLIEEKLPSSVYLL